MSFNNALGNLKNILQNDSSLGEFCLLKWEKDLTVNIEFKHRKEIPLKNLPLIMLTRPAITDRQRIGPSRRALHTIRLYAGFYQTDPQKGVSELVELEEKIDDVLMANSTLSQTVIDVDCLDSANDEGVYHPSYFLVMDLKVLFQR